MSPLPRHLLLELSMFGHTFVVYHACKFEHWNGDGDGGEGGNGDEEEDGYKGENEGEVGERVYTRKQEAHMEEVAAKTTK